MTGRHTFAFARNDASADGRASRAEERRVCFKQERDPQVQKLHGRKEDRYTRKPDAGANAARAPGNIPPVHPLHLHRYGEYHKHSCVIRFDLPVGTSRTCDLLESLARRSAMLETHGKRLRFSTANETSNRHFETCLLACKYARSLNGDYNITRLKYFMRLNSERDSHVN